MSVCPLVGHTFGFPICQRLWSPYVKSWRERTPIIFVYFPKVYFSKVYFLKVYFAEVYFAEVYFAEVYFAEVYSGCKIKEIFRPRHHARIQHSNTPLETWPRPVPKLLGQSTQTKPTQPSEHRTHLDAPKPPIYPPDIREDIKYYFADFVRKGGEGYPPNP